MFESGKLHLIQDLLMGSCAKGAVSCRVADEFGLTQVSTHNAPNAGHTYIMGDKKFVGKALPTPVALNGHRKMTAYLSPGCAFQPIQLLKEWEATGRPSIVIHSRALLVLPEHAARERGPEGTKHLGSTMQGSAAALVGKVMRVPDAPMAKDLPEVLGALIGHIEDDAERRRLDASAESFVDQVSIVDGAMFREMTREAIDTMGILHEGSQGFGLSLDHGPSYPFVTSRNVDTGTILSYMATPPKKVGTVLGVIRANHFIRVGHVMEDGRKVGDSGPVWEDSQEITWGDVAHRASMPYDEGAALLKRELTTVTGRLRRVFTESTLGLGDAIQSCGVTALAVTFIEYVNWEDRGKTKIGDLSSRSREYLDSLESRFNIPVVLVGTGPGHHECCWRTP